MKNNWLKDALHKGEAVAGVMVGELRTPALGRILDAVGADFAVIDQEHGVYSPNLLADLLAGFRGGRCLPLVRVPAIRREYFAVALDQGAVGIMVPGVESAEQARECVNLCKYPPLGTRGVCSLRAHSDFLPPSQETLLRESNQATLLIVQLESAAGIENADEILAVPGIDVAFVGCADLSASLGVCNAPQTPEMQRALERVIAAGRGHGVATGIHAYSPEWMGKLRRKGMQFFSCATDVHTLIGAWRNHIAQTRADWSEGASA